MKNKVLNFLRSKRFQPLWEKLFHYSKIGMNLWGGAALNESGEKHALKYAKENTDKNKTFIVFDVGAHFGAYSTLACELFNDCTKVFAFEPSKFNYKTFNEKTSNYKYKNNIHTYNFGFSDKKESRNLFYTDVGDTKLSLYDIQEPSVRGNNKNNELIELNTLDDFCKENNIDKIDYLKIDVEGHELYVLKGAEKMIDQKKIQYIQFEFGYCNIESKVFFRDIYNLLSANYNFYRIVYDGVRPITKYSYDLEVFYIANYLAELKNT